MIQRGMLDVLRSAVAARAKLRDVVAQWRASTEKGKSRCTHVTLGPSFLPCPHPDCAGRVLQEVRIPRYAALTAWTVLPDVAPRETVEIAEVWRVDRLVFEGEMLYGWRRVR